MVSTRCAEAPVLFAKQPRQHAVTRIRETHRKRCCFGGPRCTCRISSTVSTGSSPSTRRRLASGHPTLSLFAAAFRLESPGIIIEVGFVEMLRGGDGWRKGET